MDTCAVPDLYCPIPPAISPHAEAVDAHVAGWMQAARLYGRLDQLDRYTRSAFGTFAARVCPEADLDRLMLYAEWLAFGFFYDDQFFDETDGGSSPHTAAGAAIAAVSAFFPADVPLAVPSVGETDREHRLDVLADLVERTSTLARAEQLHRFCMQMTMWFYTYLYEPAMRADGGSLPLSGYAANRLYNIAAAPYVTLAEIVTGRATSGADIASPQVRKISCLAAYQMAWCNDIHSAGREAAVNPLIVNLTSILRRSGRSPQQAMDEAARIHDSTMRSYLELEALVLSAATAGVRQHLAALRTWMRGHYDWCRSTLRYS